MTIILKLKPYKKNLRRTCQFAFLSYFLIDALVSHFLRNTLMLMCEICSITQFLISKSSCRSVDTLWLLYDLVMNAIANCSV